MGSDLAAAARTIAYRKDYSNDGESWLPIESGTEHRVR